MEKYDWKEIEKNIDWEMVEYFAKVSPDVRWAHLESAYRTWVEICKPFEEPGWWSFDTIEEMSRFDEEWMRSLPNLITPTQSNSSASSTSTD